MSEIKIAEFSKLPGGRFRQYGPHSGQEFRDRVLIPEIKKLEDGEKLIIDLSGVYTFAPSFLDEAFSAIIRKGILSYDEFKSKIKFIADPPNQVFVRMINTFSEQAKASVDKTKGSTH